MTAHAEGTTLASVGGWTANVTLLINTEYELDPANTDTTQLVLSNTNQTITGKSGGTTWGTSRSLTSHTTGRYYFEALLTSSVTGNALGICDANFSVTSAVLGFQGSAHAIGYAPATGVVTQSSVTVTTIQTCATTHTSCVAVDIDAGLIWYRTDAGNWNNSATANPATGAGGIAFTAAGTIYAAGSVFGGDTGNAWAFNLGSATFAQTVPAGFTAWGLTSPAHTATSAFAGVGGWTATPRPYTYLDPANTDTVDITLSNGNLTMTGSAGGTQFGISRCLDGRTTGKYYYEAILTNNLGNQTAGLVDANQSIAAGNFVGFTAHSLGYEHGGSVYQNNAVITTVGNIASGQDVAVAVDIDNSLIWFRANGGATWNNNASASPVTGVGGISFTASGTIYAAGAIVGGRTGDAWAFNFGGTPFIHGIPVGYVAWGEIFSGPITHYINATFAGAGTQTAALSLVDVTAKATFQGVGGWSINSHNLDVASASFNGAGGWSALTFEVDYALAAAWAGAGSWSIDVADVAPPLLIYGNFGGVGGWSIDLSAEIAGAVATWSGAGGWIESDVQLDAITTEFDGVGSWSINARNFPVLYPGVWPGQGDLSVWLASPRTQLVWRSTSSSLIILDATSGTTFATPLLPDVSATLLFNVGQPIPNDYTRFTLTFTRPDGSNYVAYWDFYGIGEQVFNPLGVVETPAFRVGQYLVYAFAQGELDQPGSWTVTYQAGSRIVSMAFTLSPFNMMRAA